MEPANATIVGQEYPVLDQGFVRVVEWMGSDARVVQAARVSYGDGTKTVLADQNLLRYLMQHDHLSPFETCVITLHISLPIAIARQFSRHRTASISEVSGRYSVMKDKYYLPSALTMQSQSSKQCGEARVEAFVEKSIIADMADSYARSHDLYNRLLAMGLSREQARLILPVSAYTELYFTINLRNLFHFLKLRLGQGAQEEMRAYARVIGWIASQWVPVSWEAFKDKEKLHVNHR